MAASWVCRWRRWHAPSHAAICHNTETQNPTPEALDPGPGALAKLLRKRARAPCERGRTIHDSHSSTHESCCAGLKGAYVRANDTWRPPAQPRDRLPPSSAPRWEPLQPPWRSRAASGATSRARPLRQPVAAAAADLSTGPLGLGPRSDSWQPYWATVLPLLWKWLSRSRSLGFEVATPLLPTQKRGGLCWTSWRCLVHSPASAAAVFAAVGLLGPVAEEVVYRRHLMAYLLQQLPPLAATVLTSPAFAFSHGALMTWTFWCYFLPDVVRCTAYLLTRDLADPVAIHGLQNSGTLLKLMLA